MKTNQNKSETESTLSKPTNTTSFDIQTSFHKRLPSVAYHLVIVASLVVIIAGIHAASSVIVLLLLAAFFSVICTVPLSWLLRRGMSNKLAVGLIATGIFVFGSLLVIMIASHVNSFLGDLPKNQERMSSLTTSSINWLNAHGIHVSEKMLRQHFDMGKILSFVGTMLSKLSDLIAGSFLVFITIIFMLLEASGFSTKLRAALDNPEQSLAGLREFGIAARRYLLIKTLLGVVVGVTIGIWLWIFGINNAFLWGFLSFLFNFVPYIGSYIAAIPVLLLALVEQGTETAGIVLLGYLIINIVLGYLVEPRMMGVHLGLSPLVIFASLIIWGWLLGPVGTILSVPLTVLLRIAMEAKDNTRWIAILLGPERITPNKNVPDTVTQKSSKL